MVNINSVEEPRAISIVRSVDGHKFQLDEVALERLLLDDRIKNKLVCVVSVAGAFRKGKSFLLDFFLRFLRYQYGSTSSFSGDMSCWLGSSDTPLDGFSWKGGCERDTTGILMWSELFLTSLPGVGDVAIILLDTQGTFDSESTVRDCATVFALSTMISSTLVYNISQNIQEDDLQHLQLFTEYGRMAFAHSGQKPFQKLLFLVRDWSYSYDAEYGEVGGKKLLDKRLQVSDNQHPELQSVRAHIRSCFSDVSCFLMPHPGLKVATNPKFDGSLTDIEPDFKEYLKKLAPLLLSPKNLILKEINGNTIRAKDLLCYFKSYMSVFSGDTLPEPKSVLNATAEANNLAAVISAKDAYSTMMQGLCGGQKPYLCSSILDNEHDRIKSIAINQFCAKKKMGGQDLSDIYKKKLDDEIEDLYRELKAFNATKNLFKFARTPAIFFTVAVLMYVMSGFLSLVGLYYLSNLCYMIMTILFVSIITWAYTRYSGEYTSVAEFLDNIALLLSENIIKPTYAKCFNLFEDSACVISKTTSADNKLQQQ